MSALRVYRPDECGADGYPFAWHANIKHWVRQEAGHRCVRCHHPYMAGSGEWSPCDEACRHGGQGRNVHPPSGDDRCWDIPGSRSQPRHNVHPCVKPVALMRWLVRLVTPPGGLVLDPFAGSGSTGIACLLEGMEFVGIEREAEYVEIARERIAHAEAHPHDFDPDEPEPEPVPEGQLSIGGAA